MLNNIELTLSFISHLTKEEDFILHKMIMLDNSRRWKVEDHNQIYYINIVDPFEWDSDVQYIKFVDTVYQYQNGKWTPLCTL